MNDSKCVPSQMSPAIKLYLSDLREILSEDICEKDVLNVVLEESSQTTENKYSDNILLTNNTSACTRAQLQGHSADDQVSETY